MKQFLYLLLFCFTLVSPLFAQYEDPYDERDRIDEEQAQLDTTALPQNTLRNIVLGSDYGFAFFPIFYLEASPYIAYNLRDVLMFGVGGTYMYFNNYISSFEQSIYGGRAFARLRPIRDLDYYFHGEYEVLNLLTPNSFYNPTGSGTASQQYLRKNASALYLGFGSSWQAGQRFYFTSDILYNVYYHRGNSIFGSPLAIRAGFYAIF